MNKFIKTLSIFLFVGAFSFVSAQEKEVDSIKKPGAKTGAVMDDIKTGGGQPEAKEAPKKVASHETGLSKDEGYAKENVENKGNFFQRLFGGSKKKVKKENDPNS